MIELQLGVWEGTDYKCVVFSSFCKRNNKIVGDGARFLIRKKCCNYETRGAWRTKKIKETFRYVT